jgi:hypothetical protein
MQKQTLHATKNAWGKRGTLTHARSNISETTQAHTHAREHVVVCSKPTSLSPATAKTQIQRKNSAHSDKNPHVNGGSTPMRASVELFILVVE